MQESLDLAGSSGIIASPRRVTGPSTTESPFPIYTRRQLAPCLAQNSGNQGGVLSTERIGNFFFVALEASRRLDRLSHLRLGRHTHTFSHTNPLGTIRGTTHLAGLGPKKKERAVRRRATTNHHHQHMFSCRSLPTLFGSPLVGRWAILTELERLLRPCWEWDD